MKILIIEDNEKLAQMLKTALVREGFSADYLTDGAAGESRALIHNENYGLIILDLMLPGRSGEEICKKIREKGISTPILVLTAKSETKDKIFLFNLGADDYLVKPFSLEELIARIRAISRRPKKTEPKELRTGDLCVNLSTKKVFLKKKEIKLTLTEFRLLEYFMNNIGEPITRDQLLDSIWDFNFESFSNVVDVHVKNLRKKIECNGKYKFLETVRGVGYRMQSETA